MLITGVSGAQLSADAKTYNALLIRILYATHVEMIHCWLKIGKLPPFKDVCTCLVCVCARACAVLT